MRKFNGYYVKLPRYYVINLEIDTTNFQISFQTNQNQFSNQKNCYHITKPFRNLYQLHKSSAHDTQKNSFVFKYLSLIH